MILRTFWIWHTAEDGPVCEVSWDQSTVDDNQLGWERTKQTIRDLYGDSIHSEREIEVKLDYDAVLKHWGPGPMDGEVVGAQQQTGESR